MKKRTKAEAKASLKRTRRNYPRGRADRFNRYVGIKERNKTNPNRVTPPLAPPPLVIE